jgi:hypothetical protein
MSVHQAKELAFLRQTLRDRMLARDVGGAAGALGRLRDVAGSDSELRAEHARWSFRFEMLAVLGAA